MVRNLFLLPVLFIHSFVFAQEPIDSFAFKNFVKFFPALTLPDTIGYKSDEIEYSEYSNDDFEMDETSDSIDSESIFEDSSASFEIGLLEKPDSVLIHAQNVQAFLLKPKETQFVKWEYLDDTIPLSYYVVNRLNTRKNFYCLLVEARYFVYSNLYSEKYLCIVSKRGKLLDKILVASFKYGGTCIILGPLRGPYFKQSCSVVKNDLTIEYLDDEKRIRYKIDRRGRIISNN
jgi:hypothetical protein